MKSAHDYSTRTTSGALIGNSKCHEKRVKNSLTDRNLITQRLLNLEPIQVGGPTNHQPTISRTPEKSSVGLQFRYLQQEESWMEQDKNHIHMYSNLLVFLVRRHSCLSIVVLMKRKDAQLNSIQSLVGWTLWWLGCCGHLRTWKLEFISSPPSSSESDRMILS